MNEDPPAGRGVTLGRIAAAAGVSRATVDRVMNERAGVQEHTRRHVHTVAATLRDGMPGHVADDVAATAIGVRTSARLRRRLGFIVPDGDNAFLADLVRHLHAHASRRGDVEVTVRAVEALAPDAAAAALDALAASGDGVGIVGVDSPSVREAMRRSAAAGIPVVTLVTDVAHVGRASYIGIDNRAAGRLAGHLIGRFLPGGRGTVALVPGSLAYRGHEEREAGFRHVLRERFPALRIVADPEVAENDKRAFTALGDVLTAHPDLDAIYCIGAGQAGIVRALKAAGRELATVFVGHELTDHTRRWLLSGVMDATIDQNARVEAREAIDRLTLAIDGDAPVPATTIRIQPVFRENIPSDA